MPIKESRLINSKMEAYLKKTIWSAWRKEEDGIKYSKIVSWHTTDDFRVLIYKDRWDGMWSFSFKVPKGPTIKSSVRQSSSKQIKESVLKALIGLTYCEFSGYF